MELYDLVNSYISDEKIRTELESDFAKIISVASVASDRDGIYPFGKGSAKALDTALEIAKGYGFRTENHDYYCGSVIYGDSDTEVGIIAHLDVVPVADGWDTDPFTLSKRDGKYFGRGVIDDKGPFIQSLYTLRFLADNRIKLPFTVRLILGCDEEVGCQDLEHFMSVAKVPAFSFTPDSEFPICIGEKSIASVRVTLPALPSFVKQLSGGEVSNAVPGYAHAVLSYNGTLPENADGITLIENPDGTVDVKAEGVSAHASTPERGINAVKLIADFILSLEGAKDNTALKFISEAANDIYGNVMGIYSENEAFGKLTCVGTLLSVENGVPKLLFNIRFLPDTTDSELIVNIKKAVAAYGCNAEFAGHASKGYFISADDDKIKALISAYTRVTGEECEPYTMGGGTYARHLPNAVAFGSGMYDERKDFDAGTGNAHQRNECITEKELFEGIKIYACALGKLADVKF